MSDRHPADLFAAAAQKTQSVIAGVKADQLNESTPCSDWNVQALLDHLVGGTGFFAATLTGGSPETPAGDSPAAAYAAGAAKTVEAGKAIPLEQKVDSPFGNIPAGEFMYATFMDTVVHGWDLAKATGQDTTFSEEHAKLIHDAFAPNMDGLRQSGAFGPAVAVPDSASTQDKLIAMMGRQP